MKKKEVRWISKNYYGSYDTWAEEPKLQGGFWEGKGRLGSPCQGYIQRYAGIILKDKGLAKVTIERQY